MLKKKKTVGCKTIEEPQKGASRINKGREKEREEEARVRVRVHLRKKNPLDEKRYCKIPDSFNLYCKIDSLTAAQRRLQDPRIL